MAVVGVNVGVGRGFEPDICYGFEDGKEDAGNGRFAVVVFIVDVKPIVSGKNRAHVSIGERETIVGIVLKGVGIFFVVVNDSPFICCPDIFVFKKTLRFVQLVVQVPDVVTETVIASSQVVETYVQSLSSSQRQYGVGGAVGSCEHLHCLYVFAEGFRQLCLS